MFVVQVSILIVFIITQATVIKCLLFARCWGCEGEAHSLCLLGGHGRFGASINAQIVNILGVMCHTTTKLCHCSAKADIDHTNECGCVSV